MTASAFSKPSATIPVLMSLAALGLVLADVAVFGAARERDEGAVAHVFQLLIALQLPVVLFHALRWLPKSPRQGTKVLALQVVAAAAACASVALLGL